jgi:hypothetical protein
VQTPTGQDASGLDTAGHYLGVLIQNLWTAFDPGTLVVGGPSCIRYPELVQMAQVTLQAYAACAGMVAPVVRPARYGLLASAVGAAALVLHQVLRPMHPRAQRASAVPQPRMAIAPGGSPVAAMGTPPHRPPGPSSNTPFDPSGGTASDALPKFASA